MKKFIFALSAVLTAGVVSAQSYPKQPDKTIVKYTSNYKGTSEVKKDDARLKAINEITGQETMDVPENGITPNTQANPATTNDNRNKLASAPAKKER